MILSTSHYITRKSRNSFTLIEILISAALFTGIVVLSVGAFTDSISFNSGANDERAVRQSSRTFIDFITLQLRSSASKSTYFFGGDYAIDGASTSLGQDYVGTGYVLINGFNASAPPKMNLVTYKSIAVTVNGGVSTAIIIPTQADSANNIWLYIGNPNPATGLASSPGVWKAPMYLGNTTRIPPVGGNQWKSVGDLMPNNVSVGSLAFRGIIPEGTTFNADGSIKTYSVPTQPYVTIQMSVSPKSNTTNAMPFETTITSRDYSFAFPQCTNRSNDPYQGCQ